MSSKMKFILSKLYKVILLVICFVIVTNLIFFLAEYMPKETPKTM